MPPYCSKRVRRTTQDVTRTSCESPQTAITLSILSSRPHTTRHHDTVSSKNETNPLIGVHSSSVTRRREEVAKANCFFANHQTRSKNITFRYDILLSEKNPNSFISKTMCARDQAKELHHDGLTKSKPVQERRAGLEEGNVFPVLEARTLSDKAKWMKEELHLRDGQHSWRPS